MAVDVQRDDRIARDERGESVGGLNGSKRKMRVPHGGNTVKGVGRWRIEGGESERIKRKVYEARDVSAAEAACLPQPLLALRPPRSAESRAQG